MSLIYDRETKQYIEVKQYGEKKLNFLYNTFIGRILLYIITLPIFSKISGIYNNSKISKRKITPFIKEHNIDMTNYEAKEYASFNDFFTRKRSKYNISKEKNVFISPADSKLLVYKIEENLTVKIKNSRYTIEELCNNEEDAKKYSNGYCFVFRLAMDDYHRYCFVDDGLIDKIQYIKGRLHTVSSFSEKHKIYTQNTRVYNKLQTENFGDIVVIEVGALLVGRIKNNSVVNFEKSQEKGYFELGGSTIVILTKDNIQIDKDIIKNSLEGIETIIKYGERIGEKIC